MPEHPYIQYKSILPAHYVKVHDIYPECGIDHGYILVNVCESTSKCKRIALRNTSNSHGLQILDKIGVLLSMDVDPEDILILCPYESKFFLNFFLFYQKNIFRSESIDLWTYY